MPAPHLPCQCLFPAKPRKAAPTVQPVPVQAVHTSITADSSLLFRTPLQWLSLLLLAQSPQLQLFPSWGLLSPYFPKLLPLHLHFPSPGGCQAIGQIPHICWWSLHQCYLKPQRKRAALSKCQQWHGRPLPIHITSSVLLGRPLLPRNSPHNLQKASKPKKPFKNMPARM